MPDIGHAYLSASASDRWTHCPPSAKLNAEATERASPYALEGTCAHSLCEYLVLIALGRTCKDPTGHLEYYDSEMQEAAESYRDFFMEQIAEIPSSAWSNVLTSLAGFPAVSVRRTA